MNFSKIMAHTISATALSAVISAGVCARAGAPEPVEGSYIVQGESLDQVKRAVIEAGCSIEHELGIINGVSAVCEDNETETLRNDTRVRRISANEVAGVSGEVLETHYPTQVNAVELHGQGIDGAGVTVAVLDTGFWNQSYLIDTPNTGYRVLAQYDVIRDRMDPDYYESNRRKEDYDDDINDDNGHGTHITSIILSSAQTERGSYNGIAPGANLVSVRAFNGDGQGTYADLIQGLDWIVENKHRYDIRVLNLSFSAHVGSRYWEDPLNQAVMAAWKAGIVVVSSAGNLGPDPMTIGVPGNNPYVITVGAMTDSYTPYDPTDDVLASFSSAGPTHEGFIKPEIVAPGGHVLGLMAKESQIAEDHPDFVESESEEYFMMSGTSQSAAVVSGVVALMLQADPNLKPDDVKCRLLSTARAAHDEEGRLAYSVFQSAALPSRAFQTWRNSLPMAFLMARLGA